MKDVVLEIDSRRRVALGSLFDEAFTRLTARPFDDGTVVVEPADVAGTLETRFHSDTEAVETARQAAWSSSATKIDLRARRAARVRG